MKCYKELSIPKIAILSQKNYSRKFFIYFRFIKKQKTEKNFYKGIYETLKL